MKKPQRPSVGRILHYWTWQGDRLIPNPAIVLAIADDGGRLWLQVFYASAAGGRDQVWAPPGPWSDGGVQVPTEGHWTWPLRV